ncbi:MAG: YggT family protein [Anaerolineae bacterium]|nr:YggT family protein [Anaerolineales bacterium]MCK6626500.1 YggT family protein [Anaerolineae bacterium]MCQ3974217.1 YggT family protein [Anaerolineae bacterium]
MGEILASVINIVFQVLWWAILIRVLLSWLPMANVRIDPYNPAIRFLYSLTDPILEPLRRFTTIGMIDLSPLVALLLLDFLRQILISMLI